MRTHANTAPAPGRPVTADPSLEQLKTQLATTYQRIEQRIDRLNGELHEARSERLAELAEKERLADRLQSLLTALPAAVLVLDGSGRVQQCNRQAERLLAPGLTGQLWRDLIDRLFLPQSAPATELALRSGRYVTLSTCPLGQEPGQVLLLQDVTERRQLQQHLEHSRRLADMGRMAASLAHQIRTPLASALLYVSQLRNPALDETRRGRALDRALVSLNGLEQLIGDMLLFANGGRGERECIGAAPLLCQALASVKERLDGQCIAVVWQDEATTAQVVVNRPMVLSALQNLLENARQAMPEGGRLTLSLHQHDGVIDFIVGDSGPGVDEALRERVFEPFVSGRAAGTGLGLAVVRAVARSMGGDVWFESQPGQGSRFALRLPLVEEAHASLSPSEGH